MNTYILIGPAGCGKSTYAQQLLIINPDAIYISSDDIRKQVTGDESDMSRDSYVWHLVRTYFENALRDDKHIIFDATNYKRKSRKDFICLAKQYNSRVIAVDCFTGLDETEVKRRNKNRVRVVPDFVIEKMCREFAAPATEEGFDDIITVSDE